MHASVEANAKISSHAVNKNGVFQNQKLQNEA